MKSFVFIFYAAVAFAAEEYKSQSTYPAPATPAPAAPPRVATYVEHSAPPPPPAVPAPAPAPAPYVQQSVPAPAPAPYVAPATAPPPTVKYVAPTAAPYIAPAPAPPPPPPAPHPQPAYIEHSAPPPPVQYLPQPQPQPQPQPHPTYIEHSVPLSPYPASAPPQPQPHYQAPQQHQAQYAYNGGPRQVYAENPPAVVYHQHPDPKAIYVEYQSATRAPYPYPSYEVLPHEAIYQRPSTRRPTTTTTRKPTTVKPRPGWGDTEYNYPERQLPLKGCFYNDHGYACCNLQLQNKMEELADELLNNGTFHRCNVQKLANDLQDHVETAFREEFETVVGLSDFAERIHFREHYVCKIEVNGRYMLAWATPDDHSGRAKRGLRDDIHEYNF